MSQEDALYDAELNQVYVESPKSYKRTVINNPFQEGSTVAVKEEFYVISVEGKRIIIFIADNAYREFRTREATKKIPDVRTPWDVTKFFGLRYKPRHNKSMYLGADDARMRLKIIKSGVEYFNNSSHYREEGFDSSEEQIEDWLQRYSLRPDFSVDVNPLCFYCEFEPILD